ncbi:hypothetical protein SAMN06295974_2182 [Plantibacter flavus]|uniref:Lipoprotein n=1 Tax=Plantibacter flavus TaxID=150123 RepID=A0A3N2BZJ7_9MICO|nr:hypothetical protein [Plantibacter flavus]ROR80652.1 hypothetical protein EDD42_0695 [Plantibacter flavus]SMG32506.1 hypothetical protein SAMN06295974_2182 [Plantibacter flavus]
MRRLVNAPVALATVLLLTGCSDASQVVEPKPTGDTIMTPDEAKHDLWDRLDAAETALGGTWDKTETEVAHSCEQGAGFYYDSWRRRTEHTTNPDEPTDTLIEFWTNEGYTLRTGSYSPEHRFVTATTPNGTKLYYAIGKTGTGEIDISGYGPCIPGDYKEVSDEDFRRYKENNPAEFPTPSP